MSEAGDIEIRSVLIPLAEGQLLLPNVVVAEVMGFQAPTPREDAPEWFLGDLSWRGTTVPIVSIEGLMGHSVVKPQRRGRTIVTNTINGEKTLPHIAIIAQAIPSLVRVNQKNIMPADAADEEIYLIKQLVSINDTMAMIPDLDELERRVLEVNS